MSALPRDPTCLVIFWEVGDAMPVPAGGSVLTVRICDTTFRDYDGTNANDTHDIAAPAPCDHLYVAVEGKSGRTLTVELGLTDGAGAFTVLARSQPADMPRKSVAARRAPVWMTVAPAQALAAVGSVPAKSAPRPEPRPRGIAAVNSAPSLGKKPATSRQPKPIADRDMKIVRPTARRLLPTPDAPDVFGPEWTESTGIEARAVEWPASVPPEVLAPDAAARFTQVLLGKLAPHRWQPVWVDGRRAWRTPVAPHERPAAMAHVPVAPHAVPTDLEICFTGHRRLFHSDRGRWMVTLGPWLVALYTRDVPAKRRRLDAWTVSFSWTGDAAAGDAGMSQIYGMIFGAGNAPKQPVVDLVTAKPAAPHAMFEVLPRDPNELPPPAISVAHSDAGHSRGEHPEDAPAPSSGDHLTAGASENLAPDRGLLGFIHRVLDVAHEQSGHGLFHAGASENSPAERPIEAVGSSEYLAGERPVSASEQFLTPGGASENWAIVCAGGGPMGLSSEQVVRGGASEQPLAAGSGVGWLASAMHAAFTISSEQFVPGMASEQVIAGGVPGGASEQFLMAGASEIFAGASEWWGMSSEQLGGASEQFAVSSEQFLGASENWPMAGASEQWLMLGASGQFIMARASGEMPGQPLDAAGLPMNPSAEKWVAIGAESAGAPPSPPTGAQVSSWREQPAESMPEIVRELAGGKPEHSHREPPPPPVIPAARPAASPVGSPVAAPHVAPSPAPRRESAPRDVPPPRREEPPAAGVRTETPASSVTAASAPHRPPTESGVSTFAESAPAAPMKPADLMPEMRRWLNGLGIATAVSAAVAFLSALVSNAVGVVLLVVAFLLLAWMLRKRAEAGPAAEDMVFPTLGIMAFAVALPFVVVRVIGFTGLASVVVFLLIVAAEVALFAPLVTRSVPPPPASSE